MDYFNKLFDFLPDRFIFSGMVKIRGIGKQTRHNTFQNTVLIWTILFSFKGTVSFISRNLSFKRDMSNSQRCFFILYLINNLKDTYTFYLNQTITWFKSNQWKQSTGDFMISSWSIQFNSRSGFEKSVATYLRVMSLNLIYSPRFKKFGKIRLGSKLSLCLI